MTEKEEKQLFLKEFGLKVKGARIKRKLTRSQLAIEMGIDRVHLIRIEDGNTNTTVDVVRKICAVLNVKPGSLFP